MQADFQDRAIVTPALPGAPGGGVRISEAASAAASSQVLHLEGVLCDEFFKAREAIYGMHSAV